MVEQEDKYSRFERDTGIDLLAEIAGGGSGGGLENYYTKTEANSLLANKSNTGHTHLAANITDLQALLDAKQNSGDYATNTALTNGLTTKANSSHTHAIADVNDLQTSLDAKQAAGDYATNTALTNGLATKAAAVHTHAISDITNLQVTLDGKQAAGSYATSTDLTTGLAAKLDIATVNAKGDLLVATADDTISRLAAGSNNQVLTADSSQTTGLKWSSISTLEPLAQRYQFKALTFGPQDISVSGTKSVALTQNRLYAMWLPLPTGTLITGIRLPLVTLASGAGTIFFAVYQHDLTQASTTADLNSALTAGSAAEYRNIALSSTVTTTGIGFWLVLHSKATTGPGLFISDPNGIPGWASNPAGNPTALLQNDVTGSLPSPLVPGSMTAYQDLMVGVY